MQVQGTKVPPIVFVSHGGPPTAFRDSNFHSEEENKGIFDKIRAFGTKLLQEYNIKAALIISAHYEGNDFQIVSNENPKTVHDHGFSEYFSFQYKEKNDTKLAKEICDTINASGLKCRLDSNWGYDHGCYNAGHMLFDTPNKQGFPVLNLSLKSSFDIQDHLNYGKILRKFREEHNCIIVCSGSSSHNLRDLFTNMRSGGKSKLMNEYKSLDTYLDTNVLQLKGDERIQHIEKVRSLKEYKPNHPSDEHFFPFIVAVGAAGELEGHKF